MTRRKKMTNTKRASRCTRQSDSPTLNKRTKIIAFFYGFIKGYIPEHKEEMKVDALMVALGWLCFGLMFVLGRLICLMFSAF